MKILYLTTHLNTGGITAYLYTLAKGLIEKNHDVHVISCGGDMESSFQSLGVKVVNLDIRTKSELSLKIYLNLSKVSQYILDNSIDVVHSQTRVTQVMGSLVKKKSKCSYVSTCHGYFKPRWSRKLFGCWGDSVIAISEAVVLHLKNDFNVDAKSIDLVMSGIDLDRFCLVEEGTKRKQRGIFGLDDGFLVGMVARLSDVKGQDVLVRAMPRVFERFPNVKLVLFGQGKLEQKLKRIVSDLKLEEKVIFNQTISQPAECMSVLDVFVAPSRLEGLGLSIMEAQACGLPVVASNIGGIPSLIDNGNTGILVTPENIEELSDALITVVSDKQLLMELGKNARDHAIRNYSSDLMIEKTLKVYEKNISS